MEYLVTVKFDVSIIIPAFNREQFIARAIDSALVQTRAADEIIVVDDGSTDATPRLVRQYGDRVRLIQIENNGAGPSRPRNVGIAIATSEYFTLLDSDDLLEPTLLERHRAVLQKSPSVGLIGGNYFTAVYSPQGTGSRRPAYSSIVESLPKRSVGEGEYLIDQRVAHTAYCRGNYIQNSGVTVRKSLWEEVGGYDESLRTSNDFDFFIRVLAKCDIAYIDEPLKTFVFHDGNISGANVHKSFRPYIYENQLRVLRRELSKAGDSECRAALRSAMADWLTDFAHAQRTAHLYGQAFGTLVECLKVSPSEARAWSAVLKLPLHWLLYGRTRTVDTDPMAA